MTCCLIWIPTAVADVLDCFVDLGQMPIRAAKMRDVFCDPDLKHVGKTLHFHLHAVPVYQIEVPSVDDALLM